MKTVWLISITFFSLSAFADVAFFKNTETLPTYLTHQVSITGYPKVKKTFIQCASLAKKLMLDLTKSTSKLDQVNAFKYVDDECEVAKLMTLDLIKSDDLASSQDIESRSSWHLLQAYKIAYLEWDHIKSTLSTITNLVVYSPARGDDVLYINTDLKLIEASNHEKFPSYGINFFNGASTLRTMDASLSAQAYDVPAFELVNFTIMVWYHGGVDEERTRPVIRLGEPGTAWNDNYVVIFAVYKLIVRVNDKGSAYFQGSSTVDIDHKKWTHLAVSFDMENSIMKFYIDGVPAGDKDIPIEYEKLDGLGQVNVGSDGATGTYCRCDITELEVYNQALTEQEILKSASKFTVGP